MARQKKTIVTGVSREQMEEAFGCYALADAKIQSITGTMDAQIVKIREKYQEQLAELTEKKNAAFEVMQTYATEKRDELFTKKKSMETAHGVLGFRTGTPKLKTMRGFTWGAVLQILKRLNPDYVRTSEEVAKSELLADREKEATQELYKEIGVYVDQDETFFVEPKKEEANHE